MGAKQRLTLMARKMKWKNVIRKFTASEKKYIDETFDFLKKNGLVKEGETSETLSAGWGSYVNELFDPEHPDEFYEKWKGDAGASNLIANTKDQFSRLHIMYALIKYFFNGGRFLDFGCGTAVLSLEMLFLYDGISELVLSDVDNTARDFTKHMAKKHSEEKISFEDIKLSEVNKDSFDSIMCVHVLEHLKNSSEVFMLLDEKLKIGGTILLEAPWGGHPEHLPEAPIDWNNSGGANLLREKYTLLEHLDPYHVVSGVYKKVK